ncbi:MAG: hypothetical protein P1S60_06015, partial [Anaerolineae bacterium]|nr:hypothetical protein [Anaerolineae bacterium]
DASSFILDMEPSIGAVTIKAYEDSANLVGGEIILPQGVILLQDFSAGNRSRLRLSTQPASRSWWPGKHESWDVELNGDVLIDLNLDMGIADGDIDARDLHLNAANVDFGIGTVHINLPASGNYTVRIDGGIGAIVLEIPTTMAARITTDTGIATRTLPPDYRQNNEVWTSPGYEDSENRTDIDLSVGIGTVLVKNTP